MTETTGTSAEQVTLNTIRQHVKRILATAAAVPPPPHSHAAGYDHACRDVLAILDMNGRPLSEPARFGDPAAPESPS